MWLPRPSDDKSVTLTFCVVFGAALLVAAGLEVAGVTKGTSILLEAFVGCLATYLGRKLQFKGQTYSSDNNQGESK